MGVRRDIERRHRAADVVPAVEDARESPRERLRFVAVAHGDRKVVDLHRERNAGERPFRGLGQIGQVGVERVRGPAKTVLGEQFPGVLAAGSARADEPLRALADAGFESLDPADEIGFLGFAVLVDGKDVLGPCVRADGVPVAVDAPQQLRPAFGDDAAGIGGARDAGPGDDVEQPPRALGHAVARP